MIKRLVGDVEFLACILVFQIAVLDERWLDVVGAEGAIEWDWWNLRARHAGAMISLPEVGVDITVPSSPLSAFGQFSEVIRGLLDGDGA